MLSFSAYEKFVAKSSSIGFYLVAVGVAVLDAGVRVNTARQKDQAQTRQESPLELCGPLEVFIEALCLKKNIAFADGKVRACVWKVYAETAKKKADTMQQVTRYVGSVGGEAGRTQSSRSGVIGRCALTSEVERYHRKSDSEAGYRQELINLGFKKREAEGLLMDRWSFLALPLYANYTGKEIIGVIYVDSSEKNLFDDETVNYLADLASGVARFIYERYK